MVYQIYANIFVIYTGVQTGIIKCVESPFGVA